MSEPDMENHIAHRNCLLDLHDEKTSIDESYKPIVWFEIKHECEDPGLMKGISYNSKSQRDWSVNKAKWCILDARDECVAQYNKTNKMPYFSIFKNYKGNFQWALFEITDEHFNTKSVKQTDFSTIELEQDDLVMNINFKGGDITFNDKNNISIPSNYTINSGKGYCKKTVEKNISDCERILQEKNNKCNVAKNSAIAANERIVQNQLLTEIDDLIDGKDGMSNVEGFDFLDSTSKDLNLVSASKDLNDKIKDYSEKGGDCRKDLVTEAKANKNSILDNINDKIFREEEYNYADSKWKEMKKLRDDVIQKYKKKIDLYRTGLVVKKINYNIKTKRHYKNADDAIRNQNKSVKNKKCSEQKSKVKYYTQKKWVRGRRRNVYTTTPKNGLKCNIEGYEPNNKHYYYNAVTETEGLNGDIEGWFNGPKKLRRTKTNSNKMINKILASNYNAKANLYGVVASAETVNAENYNKKANKYKDMIMRSKPEGFKSNTEGYGVKNTCNNSDVDTNFEISHDNSIHNCNSESVFLKYNSADYKKTVDVIEDHTFTLPSSILSNITPALFNSSAGECNNNTNIKNQRLELNYSIKYDKEDIKIEEIMIDSQGKGMLKYTANDTEQYNYILSDKSNNTNERRIIMDGNGNIKMNKDVIFINPIKTDADYIVGGYTSNNNLSILKSGEEISSSKYRLTLGSAWNNSTMFYNTNNTNGNTGVSDLHGNSFKYTEHYHKNKSSTVENVFILYKIKTHELPKLLYEYRIYANIERVLISECDTNKGAENLCYIRAIKQKLVGDEMLDENNNVNFKNIQSITMDEFKTNVNYNTKFINNDVLSSVPENINEIRIFLIKSLHNIHMDIASVMKSGVCEGFKGYDNEFRGYSTIEGYTVDDSGVIKPDNTLADSNLRLLDKLKAQNDRINKKTVDMSNNAHSIRTKLTKLTGYDNPNSAVSIHGSAKWTSTSDYDIITKPDAELRIHNDYDKANNLIPFIFDISGTATDYYKKRTVDGKPDSRAKIDAIDEDLKEMLYQQNILYTIGSITSATFIITAILLARNNSS